MNEAEADALIDWLASVSQDPEAFVMGAFPWGEEGALANFTGPDVWQTEVLRAIKSGLLTVDQAIRIARASGHGIGKSALVAWIILWAFTTAADTRGVVTANTEVQLRTKTWSELGKWYNLFIGRDHFVLTATALLSKDPARERTWRIDAVPWSEKNPEAFAGMHNQGRRLLLIMDEASAIPDMIHEVAEGALSDRGTEIIWMMFGNPTRNSGRFKEAFAGGRFAKLWQSKAIDSRTVAITNKIDIQQKIEAYGEDSDYIRIRVKGEFPRIGDMEFFSASEVEAAMLREVSSAITDPLALGVDVARFGKNNSVIYPRKGRDARSIPRKVYNGISTTELATKVFDTRLELHADGTFVDGGGVGGGVVDILRFMHLQVFEVQFGGKDDVGGTPWGIQGEKYANKRAAMYGAARAWVRTGALPNDPGLKDAMLAIRYSHNIRDEIVIASKEEIMEDNPGLNLDDLDAFCLTFAYPLASHAYAGGEHMRKPEVLTEYDPFAIERMSA